MQIFWQKKIKILCKNAKLSLRAGDEVDSIDTRKAGGEGGRSDGKYAVKKDTKARRHIGER